MISQLASPAVCVIEDEKDDYEPILRALNGLYVSSIHIAGSLETLPPQPFSRLQLVFLDLHLAGSIGKSAASHTAAVFRRIVAIGSAPVIVVIWSKYADELAGASDFPVDDQETEAQLFKRTLLEAEPDYEGRLIFVEMDKPKKDDRPEDWTERLKLEVDNVLRGQSAVELLWTWDDLVRDGCAKICRDMTTVATVAIEGTRGDLKDGLQATMQRLAKAPSAGNFSSAMAPKHLLTVLTQLLADQLEHPTGLARISAHGRWLSQTPAGNAPAAFPGKINGLLLTSDNSCDEGNYAPGTVFKVKDENEFLKAFGKPVSDLVAACFAEKQTSSRWSEWHRDAIPILIEISPICDMAQGYRVNSLLVGGLIVPDPLSKYCKQSGDAFGKINNKFYLRWAISGFEARDVSLAYCHRYKMTLPAEKHVQWLDPWFRLRELPLAAIRNSTAAHSARVGYVSMD